MKTIQTNMDNEDDVRICGDLTYYANNQESIIELSSLIQILKIKKRLFNFKLPNNK